MSPVYTGGPGGLGVRGVSSSDHQPPNDRREQKRRRSSSVGADLRVRPLFLWAEHLQGRQPTGQHETRSGLERVSEFFWNF